MKRKTTATSPALTPPLDYKAQWTAQLHQLQQRVAADTVTCYRLEGALWALDQLAKEAPDGRE